MHITKLIMIAEKPKIITRSLKKGSGKTWPDIATAGFLASSRLIKIKIKKQMLHMKVNLEKNEISFMKLNV
jgi:hypothetical protein